MSLFKLIVIRILIRCKFDLVKHEICVCDALAGERNLHADVSWPPEPYFRLEDICSGTDEAVWSLFKFAPSNIQTRKWDGCKGR